jgi:hypothetical protein
MTPKEVKKALTDHPRHAIYMLLEGWITFHVPSSKTRVIRNARYFKGFRCGTYLQERWDLDPKRISNGNQKIITFYQEKRFGGDEN